MAVASDFDPTEYLRPPRANAEQAITLSIALLAAVPKGVKEGVARAAERLRSAAITLQKAWIATNRVAPGGDKTAADNRVDTAWGVLRMRIEAYSYLPKGSSPLVARAEELLSKLFPDGLKFLSLAMDLEWAVSEALLARIDAEHFAADINAIAGPEFLAEVRAAHVAYGQVLGLTTPDSKRAESAALVEPLRDLMRAIADYALQIAATVDRDRRETIEAARAALAPLDRARDGSLVAVPPETPIP